MRRKHLFDFSRRPVMGGAHGGTVHHTYDWVVSHKVLLEVLGGILAVIVIGLLLYTLNLANTTTDLSTSSGAQLTESELHNYDAIEAIRAARLINPPPVADRSYDTIEAMRAQRTWFNAAGDHSYDGIEAVRARRLINPLPTPDHSYDALEENRLEFFESLK